MRVIREIRLFFLIWQLDTLLDAQRRRVWIDRDGSIKVGATPGYECPVECKLRAKIKRLSPTTDG